MPPLLDLDDTGLRVYRTLLRRPGTSSEMLAAASQLPEEHLPVVLGQLRDRGLVRVGSDGTLVGERPDLVVGPALAARQRALATGQQQLTSALGELGDLVELYVDGRTSSTAPVEVERVEGRAATLARLSELTATATHETLAIGVSTAIAADEVPGMREADDRSRKQGAHSRTIQPAAVREVDHLMAYALEASTEGDEYRVLERPPMTLVVVDAAVGLVPLQQAHVDAGAYVVWSPSVVRAFVELFELAWQAAEPLFSPHVVPSAADPLSPRDRQLLELLAAGAQDDVAARRLGVGVRTVRRDISRLMTELGAGTRLQAGVEAARRGWL